MAATPIQKSFGTLTRAFPLVRLQFNQFKAAGALTTQPEGWKSPVELPRTFDGREVWKGYLSPIRDQKSCGNCYAIATADCLGDRYNLFTSGQLDSPLSACAMTICEYDLADAEEFQKAYKDFNSAQIYSDESLAKAACFGNTLYNAARYTYYQGLPYVTCCGQGKAWLLGQLQKWDEKKNKDLPVCEKLQGLEHDHCSDGETAMRVFRSSVYAAVAGCPEDGGSVELLKYVLFKFGPFAAGFEVYDDFLNKYDGKTVYDHKKSPDEKILGGHAIRVVGWKELDDGTQAWIIANSWSENWGDKGFFYMKMGGCNLEKNVVVTLPELEGYKTPYSKFANILLTEAEKHIREKYQIDLVTRYPLTAIQKLASGLLKGDTSPAFDNDPKWAIWLRKPDDFYLGKDVPQPNPKVPTLPEIPIKELLAKYGLKAVSSEPGGKGKGGGIAIAILLFLGFIILCVLIYRAVQKNPGIAAFETIIPTMAL